MRRSRIQILQAKAECQTLDAYLKGLNFHVAEVSGKHARISRYRQFERRKFWIQRQNSCSPRQSLPKNRFLHRSPHRINFAVGFSHVFAFPVFAILL